MALIAFDFDGTLSQSDLSVLLGREMDLAGEVRGLAEQGLRGEIDFGTSLRERVKLLEGLPERRVDAAFERVRLRTSVPDLIGDLRRADVHVAIITGSFERGVEAALERADLTVDTLVANRLVIENDALTGEVEGPLVYARKDEALEQLAATEGISLDSTIAVGNGAADLPMLKIAGTAIGFDPVPVVEPHCDSVFHSIRQLRLYLEQHGML